MLAIKRSAGVAPEADLRIPLRTGDETSKWGESGASLSEVQSRGISGPANIIDVLQEKFEENKIFNGRYSIY